MALSEEQMKAALAKIASGKVKFSDKAAPNETQFGVEQDDDIVRRSREMMGNFEPPTPLPQRPAAGKDPNVPGRLDLPESIPVREQVEIAKKIGGALAGPVAAVGVGALASAASISALPAAMIVGGALMAGEQFGRFMQNEEPLSDAEIGGLVLLGAAGEVIPAAVFKGIAALGKEGFPALAQTFTKVANNHAAVAAKQGFEEALGNLPAAEKAREIAEELVLQIPKIIKAQDTILGKRVGTVVSETIKKRGDIPVKTIRVARAAAKKIVDIVDEIAKNPSLVPDDMGIDLAELEQLKRVFLQIAQFKEAPLSQAIAAQKAFKTLSDAKFIKGAEGVTKKATSSIQAFAKRASKIMSKAINRSDPNIRAAREAFEEFATLRDKAKAFHSRDVNSVLKSFVSESGRDTRAFRDLQKLDKLLVGKVGTIDKALNATVRAAFAPQFPLSLPAGAIGLGGVATGVAGAVAFGGQSPVLGAAVGAFGLTAMAAASSPRLLAAITIAASRLSKTGIPGALKGVAFLGAQAAAKKGAKPFGEAVGRSLQPKTLNQKRQERR